MKIEPKYRNCLPQLGGGQFLTDGGLETTLIFHEGWKLPMAEAFTLLDSERGVAVLRDYYERYITLARASARGFILESPTWRANRSGPQKLDTAASALPIAIVPRFDSWRTCARAMRLHRRPCRSAAASGHAATATIPAE
jgi:homocysteine S-methyltransferase